MNHAMLQRIVEEVAARLRHRALSTATLSVAQLGEADIRSLLCQHASLRIVQVDLPLLEQLAGQRALAAAGCALHEAMAWGVRVQLTLLPALLPRAGGKKTRPLAADVQRSAWPARQASRRVGAHHADVARFSGGYLVLRRRPIITRPRPRSGSSRGMFN
ncbi:PduM family microcompartment protein [Klebsiella pneumoniae subsp. pneumoniae]|nr:PduM family microcompartment protein [Klebsiella pneumoniae subsp. pneumoniae]